MITCHLRYLIDPYKLREFEHYGKLWIPLVENLAASTTVTFYLQKAPITSRWQCLVFPAWRCMKRIDLNP